MNNIHVTVPVSGCVTGHGIGPVQGLESVPGTRHGGGLVPVLLSILFSVLFPVVVLVLLPVMEQVLLFVV